MAEALSQALSMPLEERKARHADMMARLRASDLSTWRDAFLEDLRRVATAASVTRKAVKLADVAGAVHASDTAAWPSRATKPASPTLPAFNR
jgi:trehalose-6-phosphate synthase